MFCVKCGAAQQGFERFCARCGCSQPSQSIPLSNREPNRNPRWIFGLTGFVIVVLVIASISTSTLSHHEYFSDEHNGVPEGGGSAPHTPFVSAAPEGNSVAVAQQVILENFEPSDCPSVTDAQRMEDGGIRAVCSNGEIYRILKMKGKALALKCSAAAKLGVSGC